MKNQLNNILSRLIPLVSFFKKYIVFIFVMIIFGIFGFFVFRINQYSNSEPSDEAVSEKLQTVQRPRIDQAVIDTILKLQNQNIQVQSLFDQARSNPFDE